MASIIYDQAGQPVHYRLSDSAITIGRNPTLNVVFSEEVVSRRHARIFRGEDSWQLQDLGSTGGTFVNRKRVLPEQPVSLSHRDLIRIGPHKIQFENEQERFTSRRKKATPGFEIDDDSDSSILGSLLTSGYGPASVRPQEKLNGILKINEALAGNVDFHAICPRVLDTLFEIFPQTDRGAIGLLQGAGIDLTPVAQRHRRLEDTQPVRISRTILRRVLDDNSAILSTHMPRNPQVADSDSVRDQKIQSNICAPMHELDGNPFGIISLDSQDPRKQFSPEDLQLLVVIANQASHAYENARLLTVYKDKLRQDQEMEFSARIQRSLIPTTIPQPAGYRIYGSYNAAQLVGGDYYDCFAMPNGKICISFGDVEGKGFPAALMMARLSGIVRNVMHFTDDVELAMCQINSLMCNDIVDGKFVTYLLGVLDPEAHTFTFSNAGHMPPEVRSSDATLSNPGFEHSGPPIGVDLKSLYSTSVLTLPAGSIIILRTDGVDEAMSVTGEQYRDSRFREVLRSSPADPEAICRALLADVKEFAANAKQNDDITIMAFGRMP